MWACPTLILLIRHVRENHVATGTQMMKTTPEVGLGNYVSKFIQASDQARSYKITE